MFKETKYFLAATALLGLALSGCSDGLLSTSTTTTTTPNASALTPTGTVTGLLTDKVTNQPIVGAVIDIDGLTATTNENGQYSIKNVPATEDALNGSVTGTYTVTVNLKKVTSPVNMVNKVSNTNCGTAAAPKACYPEFAYGIVIVSYTSLDDTSGTSAGAGGGTNHDTPVTGLSAIANVAVGKLAATITGVVGYQKTKLAVVPTATDVWTVQLVSNGSNNAASPATNPGVDAGTGSSGNIVGTTTADSSGAFTFANVESLGSFKVTSWNTAGTYRGSENVTAPADDETKTLTINGDPADISDLRTVLVEVATSTVTGEIVYASNNQLVPAGLDVKLYSGANVVGSTTTDANGKFTFSNVAANTALSIGVTSTDGKFATAANVAVTSPGFGETKSLTVQGASAIKVVSTDTLAPFVVSASPENNSDQSPTGGINVVFTFSEPIKADAYATTLSNNNVFGAGATGLWSDVAVNFNGFKAGNIAHTLSWSADRKVLTVNISTLAPASKYSVDITATTGKLTDDTGTVSIVAALPIADYRKVDFTTNGAATAAAPSDVALVNDASIDVNVAPVLDWSPVSGAKKYNVYRATNEVWGARTNAGAYALLGSANTSNYSDAAQLFVENSQIKLTYSYVVKSVNADGTESAASTAVTADDVVGPTILGATALNTLPTVNNASVVTLVFNELLDETTAKTANFSWKDAAARDTATSPAAISISGAVYDIPTKTVTLTLSGILNPTTLTQTYFINPTGTGATGVTPALTLVDDTQSIAVGSGVANSTCITAGVDTILQSTVTGDDVVVGTTITSGPNGICASTLLGDDVRPIPAGQGTPYAPVTIKAGANLWLDTSYSNMACVTENAVGTATTAKLVGSDDVQVIAVGVATTAGAVIINSGADGICNTTAAGGETQAIAVGQGLPTRTNAIQATGVKDVAGNVVRTSADVIDTDGTIE